MTDDQFKTLSQQIADLGKHFDEQIVKLYAHAEKRFDEVEGKLDGKADKAQADQILNLLDGFANRVEADDQERAAMSDQLDRQHGWIGQLAKNTNTKLSPEL